MSSGLRFRVGEGPAGVNLIFDLQAAFGAAARAQLAKLPRTGGEAAQTVTLFRVFAEPNKDDAMIVVETVEMEVRRL